ncbi:MFS transporter, partial [Citrobacter freundii]|nr:MFS transporter [Citrobacter freundii]
MTTTQTISTTQVNESGAWKPVQLESKDVTYATWIAFFAWVFAVYDFILFGTLLPVMGGHFTWSEA